jgi:hypothetical protein
LNVVGCMSQCVYKRFACCKISRGRKYRVLRFEGMLRRALQRVGIHHSFGHRSFRTGAPVRAIIEAVSAVPLAVPPQPRLSLAEKRKTNRKSRTKPQLTKLLATGHARRGNDGMRPGPEHSCRHGERRFERVRYACHDCSHGRGSILPCRRAACFRLASSNCNWLAARFCDAAAAPACVCLKSLFDAIMAVPQASCRAIDKG